MTRPPDLLADVLDGIDALLVFSPSGSYYDRVADVEGVDVVVVATENAVGAETFVELPLAFDDVREQIRFGIEGALSEGVVADGDELGCVAPFLSEEIDMVTRTRANAGTQSSVYELFASTRAEPGVIRDVFDVAIELGRKGQKGKPVGALFVVGDAGKVMTKSRPLSYNPFEKSHVHVGDPIVNVMLKEFSRLDGAFVISDSGKIVSSYRYLEPGAEGTDIPKGLGARHMAAGAITRDTNAVAIVLSESDGLVRAFRNGELVLELDPEEN
ncbi:diadenylate cyclase DacZ [Halobacterium salinarum]|uniref:diadenylate cyclase DacZ n=1 Tax=Halobacterium TaxID=2239 RepID=UPI001965866C|nr:MULTISPECIES: diadenylate cyclase DacZ [Halobacterium]MCF2165222.1 diadenylate cyclase [Halobacterium salinarum]MCF2167969.1 diadenylate cyclase [Halobacterium salinarum]MCF2208109.1 diadenylate cyclase [Halobacterium salinarum]MCF2238709.1 diadenylate cyclase [Halobacterium salinarum]MCF2240006.1 diadenylate cyclase [Halobacterium salinarum]